ncbi:MAG: ribosomal-processing cysteine protease Prp [Alkalispirochaetaceae bacterium]
MIALRVELDRGRLLRLRSEGHAVAGDEGSVPCAAVSALIGSASRSLVGVRGCDVDGSAPEPGKLELRVLRVLPWRRRWLRGVTDLLVQGLRDVAEEYPGAVQLIIEEKGE